ncbi:hypothetical protein GCM10020218_030230 [Dactylosporangium vinaceum]
MAHRQAQARIQTPAHIQTPPDRQTRATGNRQTRTADYVWRAASHGQGGGHGWAARSSGGRRPEWWPPARVVAAGPSGGRRPEWWPPARVVAAGPSGGRRPEWWPPARVVAAGPSGGRRPEWWTRRLGEVDGTSVDGLREERPEGGRGGGRARWPLDLG